VSDHLHINATPQYSSLLYDLRIRGMHQTILDLSPVTLYTSCPSGQ